MSWYRRISLNDKAGNAVSVYPNYKRAIRDGVQHCQDVVTAQRAALSLDNVDTLVFWSITLRIWTTVGFSPNSSTSRKNCTDLNKTINTFYSRYCIPIPIHESVFGLIFTTGCICSSPSKEIPYLCWRLPQDTGMVRLKTTIEVLNRVAGKQLCV